MPSWLILVLQWGGLALAVLSAAALIYFLGIPGIMEPAAEADAAAEQVTAPVTMYWVLLVIGVVGASDSLWAGASLRLLDKANPAYHRRLVLLASMATG